MVLSPVCLLNVIATWVHLLGGLGCRRDGTAGEGFERCLVGPAFFCAAEQNSSEVKGVWGSGMLGVSALEDLLSVRVLWKASRRGSFGGS